MSPIPLRICLFTPSFLPAVGGAERDADVIVRGLIAHGHDVHILTQKLSGKMPDLPYPVTRYLRPPAQHLWPELLSRPLKRLHMRWPIDVVLAFYSYPVGYAAARVKNKLGFAVVTTPRGGDLYPNFHALRKRRVSKTIVEGYRRSDRIVSISHWLTERLGKICGKGLPPIDLVPNGLDLAEHDTQRDAARKRIIDGPIDRPFILHLARVAPVKQQTLAVKSVYLLRDLFERHGLKYAIVGDGNGMHEVRAMITELKLEPFVKLLGTRTGLEKAWLYDRAEFMVSTSREEGFGNVVIEAMASGLPMLGSDIGPHRELIGDNGWGMLFTTGDANDLADKMKRMIEGDLSRQREMAIKCREHFTLDTMVTGYERACRTAFDERNR
jgi:glycosyltransferase involved in cell wall biosynthesis